MQPGPFFISIFCRLQFGPHDLVHQTEIELQEMRIFTHWGSLATDWIASANVSASRVLMSSWTPMRARPTSLAAWLNWSAESGMATTGTPKYAASKALFNPQCVIRTCLGIQEQPSVH